MPAGDEPLLEREAAGGSVDPRAKEVVSRGENRRLDAEGPHQAAGHGGERLAGTEGLRADEVEADVAVAELEPRLAAELAHRLERVPRLVGSAPTPFLVRDAVEVRRDLEAEHLEVVAYVDDRRHVRGRQRLGDRADEPPAADAAGEDDRPHATATRPAIASAICVRGPARRSSRRRSSRVSTSSTRFGRSTVVAGTGRARNRAALPGP